MIRTNKKKLIKQSVIGAVSQPSANIKNPYIVDPEGRPRILPGTGGVTYNVSVGDSAFYFLGDHIEPCVSISETALESSIRRGGLSILSCIGNEAEVVSGSKKGAKGIVTGKHGGVEHILVDFPRSVVKKLAVGDKVQITSFGQGLSIDNKPEVKVMNIDPHLFELLGLKIRKDEIIVPVTNVIPAALLGSGTGSRHSYSGDCDIQVSDEEMLRKNGLEELRIGDVVAVTDADCCFGRSIKSGAVSIGVVVHASSFVAGHGPGITFIMASRKRMLVPKIENRANIAMYLAIGKERKRKRRKTGKGNRR